MLREIGDRPVRVTYDRGRMEIMSPLPRHERAGSLIHDMIKILAMELDISVSAYGSTTFRSRSGERGLEPDKCYYIQHAEAMDNKETIDLAIDPPPDLAVEVDVTHRSIERLPIYASLGVPELWRHDGTRLLAMKLNEQGTYEKSEYSVAFPQLRVGEMNRFLAMWPGTSDSQIMKAFRKWVRETLIKP